MVVTPSHALVSTGGTNSYRSFAYSVALFVLTAALNVVVGWRQIRSGGDDVATASDQWILLGSVTTSIPVAVHAFAAHLARHHALKQWFSLVLFLWFSWYAFPYFGSLP